MAPAAALAGTQVPARRPASRIWYWGMKRRGSAESWRRLRQYRSVLLGMTADDDLQSPFATALHQAEQQFKAATTIGPESRLLNLFHGLSQAGRAIAVAASRSRATPARRTPQKFRTPMELSMTPMSSTKPRAGAAERPAASGATPAAPAPSSEPPQARLSQDQRKPNWVLHRTTFEEEIDSETGETRLAEIWELRKPAFNAHGLHLTTPWLEHGGDPRVCTAITHARRAIGEAYDQTLKLPIALRLAKKSPNTHSPTAPNLTPPDRC